jgi:glycosyltransferase involved in cell wall biosynthesis
MNGLNHSSNGRRVKRVLMTADCVGGVWTYALELARELERYNIDIDLALMGPPPSTEQREQVARLQNVNLFKSDYKLEWMDDCWRDVRLAGDWLLNLESRLRPDLVHLNGYAHASLPWKSPVVVVGHSCVFSWWQSVKKGKPGDEWNRYRDAVTDGLRSADLVITPSNTMLRALFDEYGPLKNCRVIANGLDLRLFKPARKENFVLAAGRLWDEAKNIRALTSIAHALKWPVYVAGEVDGTANQFAETCNYLGRLPNGKLREWFARAAIYSLPARYEPFGLSILEAALSGCALVLGNIPSLREFWSDSAVFVDPDDPEALEHSLSKLIDDDESRKRIAYQGCLRALDFSSSRMADHYAAAYATLSQSKIHKSEREELTACA